MRIAALLLFSCVALACEDDHTYYNGSELECVTFFPGGRVTYNCDDPAFSDIDAKAMQAWREKHERELERTVTLWERLLPWWMQ